MLLINYLEGVIVARPWAATAPEVRALGRQLSKVHAPVLLCGLGVGLEEGHKILFSDKDVKIMSNLMQRYLYIHDLF